jgi:hypothetical protein
MKTLQQEREELARKFEKAAEELEQKWKVLALLPPTEGYAPPMIHHYKMYGSEGGIHFNLQRYSSIAEGKSPDKELLKLMLESFPPVPIIKVREGTTSIRPEPESYESNGEVEEIEPITFRLEPSLHSQTTEVEWYAQVGELGLWRIRLEFPLYQHKLGKLDLRWSHNPNYEDRRVEVCQFYPSHSLHTIRWASGGPQYPNTFTLYWSRGETPKGINVWDLIGK